MSEQASRAVDLAQRVHDIVAQYVNQKTESKSGIAWADIKDRWKVDPRTGKRRRDVPDKYRVAREKVCQDAFLAIRACHSQEDFVAYFTGTICSVPQYLPLDEYQALAAALLGADDAWEHVKALSMLALSGQSELYRPEGDKSRTDGEEGRE